MNDSRWLCLEVLEGLYLRKGESTEDASKSSAEPSRDCISSCLNPLLSKNAIFLSSDALRTSSSSRNFFACSMIVSRLGGVDSGGEVDSGACSPSCEGSSFGFSCHVGTPAFFSPVSESLIVESLKVVNGGSVQSMLLSARCLGLNGVM